MDFSQYVQNPDSQILGCYSTERLSSTAQPKCPWGGIPTDPSDPGHKSGKGLFERHNLPYPQGVIHLGLWKFEEAEDYMYLIGSNLVGIEGNPSVYEQFSRVTCDFYGFRHFNHLVSNTDGAWVEFRFTNDRPDCGGLFTGEGNAIEVETITLDTLVDRYEIDTTNYNFLNIDTEGNELAILQGYIKNLHTVDYILVESSVDDRYNNGQFMDTICEFLLEKNFILTDMSGSFLVTGWGDALFVRANTLKGI